MEKLVFIIYTFFYVHVNIQTIIWINIYWRYLLMNHIIIIHCKIYKWNEHYTCNSAIRFWSILSRKKWNVTRGLENSSAFLRGISVFIVRVICTHKYKK